MITAKKAKEIADGFNSSYISGKIEEAARSGVYRVYIPNKLRQKDIEDLIANGFTVKVISSRSSNKMTKISWHE